MRGSTAREEYSLEEEEFEVTERPKTISLSGLRKR